MLNASKGHIVMSNKINKQKLVTRDALAYVADISRDRSMFSISNEPEGANQSTTSIISGDDWDLRRNLIRTRLRPPVTKKEVRGSSDNSEGNSKDSPRYPRLQTPC